MPFTVSRRVRGDLPDEQKQNIEQHLRSDANGICYLCEGSFNENSDPLEIDHDIPISKDGPTVESNLHLTHRECNRSKSDLDTIQIRPYLKLKRFMDALPGSVKYDGVLPHFGINPELTRCTLGAETARFLFPGTTEEVEVPVFQSQHGDELFRYCFASIPKSNIYNDSEIQPRNIDAAHIRDIYRDILVNPLHEPPNLRVSIGNSGQAQNAPLWLFDGQHKSIASWLHGDDNVTCKIYFNLDRLRANRLVNSIQSLIKKLPLSSLELSAKMGEEFDSLFNSYSSALVPPAVPSEEEFLMRFVPEHERNRARAAFRNGLPARLRENMQPKIFDFARKGRATGLAPFRTITESTLTGKLLSELFHMQPLAEEDFGEMRERERRNIARIIDYFVDRCFKEEHTEAADKTRQERMSYQGSMLYIGYMLKTIFAHEVHATNDEKALLRQDAAGDQWISIEHRIDRLVDHPCWSHPYNVSNMVRLRESMLKNQNVKDAFYHVKLNLQYCIENTTVSNWQGEPVSAS